MLKAKNANGFSRRTAAWLSADELRDAVVRSLFFCCTNFLDELGHEGGGDEIAFFAYYKTYATA